jgi:hypothetical protein
MNIEILFLAALFLIGTTLLARVAVPGIEQARFATGIRAEKKLSGPNID